MPSFSALKNKLQGVLSDEKAPPPPVPGNRPNSNAPGTPMADDDCECPPSGGGSKVLGVPKYPDLPLLPTAHEPLNNKAVERLKALCDKETKSGETYTVTNSPITCPEGKHYLYTLKPYWWETKPGCWEQRDGQRNPLCDKPQGQKQLQGFAQTIYHLAYGCKYVGESAYKEYADRLINTFFIDPETRMDPSVKFAQSKPGQAPDGNELFVVAALRQVPCEKYDSVLRQWFTQHADFFMNSPQGKSAATYPNNVGMWYAAGLATHLAYANPPQAVQYARQAMSDQMARTPSEFFAHELKRTRPRHYVLFALEAIFILAGEISGDPTQPPPPEVCQWLASLVQYARSVRPGAMEAEREADNRYQPEIAWFDRQLARWTGKEVSPQDPDGSGWEGGWNQKSKLAWQMI